MQSTLVLCFSHEEAAQHLQNLSTTVLRYLSHTPLRPSTHEPFANWPGSISSSLAIYNG